MHKSKFDSTIKFIFALGCFVAVGGGLLVYIISESMSASICAWIGMAVLLFLMLALHKTDDAYITDIVSRLSRLTDILMELEEKDIFPENEDNLLSKLQTKVLKLVRMLKKKNKQSLREKENIKALVSDISHQLKTPISNLLMYSDFLAEENLPEDRRREYLAVLRQSVERLNFLSESMIKISRLESGLIQLHMEKQSLNETVLKAVKDVYAKARAKGTEIVYKEGRNIVLSHDRNWTAEAIFNLLDNGVKYSGSGSKIYLSIKPCGMFTAVEVRDENPPIPEEERTKIFTRFYRGVNSAGKEGIGIGLYLSRQISIRQGGYMQLKCTKTGNIFSFVLGNSLDNQKPMW